MKDTRPFNIEHARAGAPFCTAGGEKVEIFKWDRKHLLCIIGEIQNDCLNVCGWTADGGNKSMTYDRTLVMTPLGYIDGKPVFVGDEIELKCFAPPHEWKSVKAEPGWSSTWNDDGKCARWPSSEAPTDKLLAEFRRWAGDDPGYAAHLVRSAADEIERLRAVRAMRDMAVAKEVVKSLCWVHDSLVAHKFDENYLLPVIARVKPC